MYQALFFINALALGIGLSMDAFSVSIANGLREPMMPRSRMLRIAGVYAVFQFLMPMIGWFLVHTAVSVFSVIEPLIPWIALILLAWIGGKMIREGILTGRERAQNPAADPSAGSGEIGTRTLLLQGVATSIDALSVGFTIAEYDTPSAFTASLLIGIITLVICLVGLRIGKIFGLKLAHRASIIGGLILIGIGLEIFIGSFLS